MDDDLSRIKWLLVVGVLFLVSMFFSWREMKYALFGVKTDAQLVRVYETEQRGRRGRRIEKLAVDYQFTDNGTVRKETDTLSIDAERPTGKTVSIQYLRGDPDRSRISGHSQWGWPLVFFTCLGYMTFKIWRIVRESKS